MDEHARYIIERIAELGDGQAAGWLTQQYPAAAIYDVVNSSRRVSPKSANFWRLKLRSGQLIA